MRKKKDPLKVLVRLLRISGMIWQMMLPAELIIQAKPPSNADDDSAQ